MQFIAIVQNMKSDQDVPAGLRRDWVFDPKHARDKIMRSLSEPSRQDPGFQPTDDI